MRGKKQPGERALAEVANRQHGIVTRRQLGALGFGSASIDRRVASGRLHRIHSGVYAVGHRVLTANGVSMGAVLACGDGALLSHASAGHLYGILRASPRTIEVTVPTAAGRLRPGIVVHRDARLTYLDASSWQGIPTTTIPRALLDPAPRLDPPQLARACHEAWIRHRITPHRVEQCLARNRRKPGAAKLRRALGADVTLSALEDGFLKLLERHGLPMPRTNIDRHGDKVDCHWPEQDLVVELVGYRFHGSRRAFEDDVARRRRSHHVAFTYGDVFERAAATAAELAQALSRGRRLTPPAPKD